jgi:hypothetical protein
MEKIDEIDEMVKAAVKIDGTTLTYASARLKDDEAIVLAAVEQDGRALMFASDRLKDNEEVVLAAVKKNGTPLIYASARLRSDVNFCIECAKKYPEYIAYFKGEAKKIFQAHQNDLEAIEEVYTQQQQNKADEAFFDKIKKTPHTTPSFKININIVVGGE